MKKAQPLLFSKKHDLCHECSPPCPTFAANKQEARRPRRARMCGGGRHARMCGGGRRISYITDCLYRSKTYLQNTLSTGCT